MFESDVQGGASFPEEHENPSASLPEGDETIMEKTETQASEGTEIESSGDVAVGKIPGASAAGTKVLRNKKATKAKNKKAAPEKKKAAPEKKKAAPEKKKAAPEKKTTDPENVTRAAEYLKDQPMAKIKLKDINLTEYWNRDTLTNIPALARSIKQVGLTTALTVMKTVKPGKYDLLAGRRRYAALQELGITEAYAVILEPLDELSRRKVALAENTVREAMNPFEIARECEWMASQGGMKNKDIAALIPIGASGTASEGSVSQYRAIMRAPEYVQEAIRTGNMAPSVTRILGRLKYDEDQAIYDKIAASLIDGTLTTAAAEDRIIRYLDRKNQVEGTPTKKSGAKTKAAAKRRGPALKVTDYSDREVFNRMSPISKTQAQKEMMLEAEKLSRTNDKRKIAFIQGVLRGMEKAFKLTE